VKRGFVVIGLILLVASLLVSCGYTEADLDATYQEGHADGYDSGSHAGYKVGYEEGKFAGLAELELAKEEAYDLGYDKGYAKGEDKTYGSGYRAGEDAGYNSGYEVGYQNGFWAGEEEASAAYHTIAEDSYYQGYTEGYADGFEAKSSAVPTTLGFVGSVNSDIYHYPWCVWAQQIYPQNEIWFDSVEDAKAHGYRPCKVCKPPGSVEANDPWEELEAVERFKELFK